MNCTSVVRYILRWWFLLLLLILRLRSACLATPIAVTAAIRSSVSISPGFEVLAERRQLLGQLIDGLEGGGVGRGV